MNYCSIKNYTQRTKNEIIIKDNYALIVLCDKELSRKCVVKIDIDDVDKCKSLKWSHHNGNYVTNSTLNILLHRFIMDCPEGLIIDHINNNRLDNRKSNLRIVTDTENSINHKLRQDNKSGITGVNWYKPGRKWRARVYKNGITVSLEYFLDLEEAKKARELAEIEYYGEYRYRRFVVDGES